MEDLGKLSNLDTQTRIQNSIGEDDFPTRKNFGMFSPTQSL